MKTIAVALSLLLFQKINVEFEARNPEEMDFHGIRQLLLQVGQLELDNSLHISLLHGRYMKLDDIC